MGELSPQRAQHTRFTDARLTQNDNALPVGERFFDVHDERGLALG